MTEAPGYYCQSQGKLARAFRQMLVQSHAVICRDRGTNGNRQKESGTTRRQWKMRVKSG